jgi:hypothetical protein
MGGLSGDDVTQSKKWRRITGQKVRNYLERTWREVVVVSLAKLSWNMTGGTEEKYDTL